jgi:hypothetical protein
MTIASSPELFGVLRQFNPWWAGDRFPDVPSWQRKIFPNIVRWMEHPPGGRALLLTGARQVGKTTLLLQVIHWLLDRGERATNILYLSLDHPLLRAVSLEGLLELWREFEPAQEGVEYLFLDEIHNATDWQVWLKHQVDFQKSRRIAVTGSATPLATERLESGVGRWHTIRLATLSFAEYLELRGAEIPRIPHVASISELFQWKENQFVRVGHEAKNLGGLFHEYLIRGGFPQASLIESITVAQRLLREDIIDRVLKRDMTSVYGVRRVSELEQVFVYLCLHDGAVLDMPQLCSNLRLNRPTVRNFIDILEATHLVYRLMPFGYGKQVLRARPKMYLADPAIPSSVLLKGKSFLEDPDGLARAAESAFVKHLFNNLLGQGLRIAYWRGPKDREVDVVTERGGVPTPWEGNYRGTGHTGPRDLKGMVDFCDRFGVEQGYVITREFADFSVTELGASKSPTRILKIPAPLACYWLGLSQDEAT